MTVTMNANTGDRPAGASESDWLYARLDRLQRWGVSPLFLFVVGLGMLFVQYDIFNINVSFAQTCTDIVDGCTLETVVGHIGTPIMTSLVGYAIGALSLGWASDKFGRHPILIVSMVITGLGSLWSAFAVDETSFALSRLVTGIGIGADLAIINTYVNEIAPRRSRAKFTSVLFLLAGVGGALGIWLGLLLTTPATAWPEGLPFALASDSFTNGWRWIYGIGAILAVLSIALRFRLPESPRWLIATGRFERAEAVVASMELRCARHGALDAPRVTTTSGLAESASLLAVLRDARFRKRFIVLSLAWMLAYVTLYAFGSAFTPVLTSIGYSVASAGMISAVGILGFIASAVFAVFFVEKLERKHWMLVGAAIAVVGALLVTFSAGNWTLVFVGAIVLFFGQNVWVAPQYALTAESYPTRVRASAYAWTDSIGHVGGGIGVFVIAGLIDELDPLATLLILCGFMIAGALVNLLAPRTRGQNLDEISG